MKTLNLVDSNSKTYMSQWIMVKCDDKGFFAFLESVIKSLVQIIISKILQIS